MNVAITTYYLPSGSKIGVGHQTHAFANRLVRRGHRVVVFSPHRRPDDAQYECVVVPVGRRLRTFRFAWNLRRYDWTCFDVLHAMTDDYWLLGKRRPRHIRTMHGSCLAECIHTPFLREKLRMALLAVSEYVATIVADETVVVSRNTLRYFPYLGRHIPCGVDTCAFSPAGPKSSHPTVLYVGTLGWRKRGWLVLKAFQEEIRPRFPDAELWMVCNDPVGAPGVRSYPWVAEAQLIDLYRRAWVFTLPSTYEGFGVPYIEAMACGTPVVATPNPGAREVLDDGRYGVLARDRDLGGAIARLLDAPGERAEWTDRGLARAADYDWERVVDAYEALYRGPGAPRRSAPRVGA